VEPVEQSLLLGVVLAEALELEFTEGVVGGVVPLREPGRPPVAKRRSTRLAAANTGSS
jgi:hypothetical protein